MLTLLSSWGIDAEELRKRDKWRVLLRLGGYPDLAAACSESFFPAHADAHDELNMAKLLAYADAGRPDATANWHGSHGPLPSTAT